METTMETTMETKLSQLVTLIKNEEWEKAFAFANKFSDLGKHKIDIERAHGAYTNPNMYEQMGHDINNLKLRGMMALLERYEKHLNAL